MVLPVGGFGGREQAGDFQAELQVVEAGLVTPLDGWAKGDLPGLEF